MDSAMPLFHVKDLKYFKDDRIKGALSKFFNFQEIKSQFPGKKKEDVVVGTILGKDGRMVQVSFPNGSIKSYGVQNSIWTSTVRIPQKNDGSDDEDGEKEEEGSALEDDSESDQEGTSPSDDDDASSSSSGSWKDEDEDPKAVGPPSLHNSATPRSNRLSPPQNQLL
jgi:hypothetical protein